MTGKLFHGLILGFALALQACTPQTDVPETGAGSPTAQPATAPAATARSGPAVPDPVSTAGSVHDPVAAPAPSPAAGPLPASEASGAGAPPLVPPRMSDPLPPDVLPAPAQLDRSCRTDADCTVKNVGNCCGEYPSCVNVSSPTDPEGVMAQCAQRGMASVCGFPALSGCRCVQGQCQDLHAGSAPVTDAPVDR